MLDPCTLVIFGASGNLAQVKLLPALFNLDRAGLLHPALRLICNGRKPFEPQDWNTYVAKTLHERLDKTPADEELARFLARMVYFRGDLKRGDTFRKLGALIDKDRYPGDMEHRVRSCNYAIFRRVWRPG